MNYFYIKEISNRIKMILDENLDANIAMNISCGEFNILPDPQVFNKYLPAVIIDLKNISNNNANESLGINYTPYVFEISYIYPYDFKNKEEMSLRAKENTRLIANILMDNKTLNDFEIQRSNKEVGGKIITSYLSSINFDESETKFFREIDISCHISKIYYEVGFRTYRRL